MTVVTEGDEAFRGAFVAAENRRMQLRPFANQLLKIALEAGVDDGEVRGAVESVVDDVANAREFNETYIGHMLSEASIPGMLGYMLGVRLGSNTVAREVSIAESRLEPEAMHGLMEMVGYDPREASGTFTSGGSMANMTALYVARRLAEVKYGDQVADKPMKIMATSMAHYSLGKAVSVLGGPGEMIQIEEVETDGYKMDPSDLEKKLRKARRDSEPVMAVFAVAGETETGLVDPLEDIVRVAEKYGVYAHADGAYGAPYRLSRVGGLFSGLERYGSISIDPHKALYTPYSTAVTLFRSVADHAYIALGQKADYLQFAQDLPEIIENFRKGRGNLGQKRIEGSMGAGPILATVATLRAMSQETLGALYDHTLDRTWTLYDRVANSDILRPMHEPELNLLCFGIREEVWNHLGITDKDGMGRFVNETRVELDREIQGKGGYFFSATTLPTYGGRWPKEWVYRGCIMHPGTTDEIVVTAVDELEGIIRQQLR